MSTTHLAWTAFGVFILAMLALDLFVFHRKAHEVRMREALTWAGVWIGLALLFNFGILLVSGPRLALEFLTAYVIEESLSIDNLFVFLLLFSHFRVPAQYQHKVLFWGILGALVMRLVFIVAGISLLKNFHWVIYLFGAILVVSGVRMFRHKEMEVHPERSLVLRGFRRIMPTTKRYWGNRFFLRRGGRLIATPLFIVLLAVETTDLVFAVDSIPAVLAISTDPFIIYTSNVFAILGLRTLFFALAGLMRLFHYLHYGLSAILVFVGVKMLLADVIRIPTAIALGVVLLTIAGCTLASILDRRRASVNPESPRGGATGSGSPAPSE